MSLPFVDQSYDLVIQDYEIDGVILQVSDIASNAYYIGREILEHVHQQ